MAEYAHNTMPWTSVVARRLRTYPESPKDCWMVGLALAPSMKDQYCRSAGCTFERYAHHERTDSLHRQLSRTVRKNLRADSHPFRRIHSPAGRRRPGAHRVHRGGAGVGQRSFGRAFPTPRRFGTRPRTRITNGRSWPIVAFDQCNFLVRRTAASRRKRP